MTEYGLYQPGEPRPQPRWGDQIKPEPSAEELSARSEQDHAHGLLQPIPPDWSGWEVYHEQMFDVSKARSGWIAWKINSTGVNIARQLVATRNAARLGYLAEHGPLEAAWPLPHPPAVLWMPHFAHAACLGCLWLMDGERGDAASAGAAARAHARERAPGRAELEQLLERPLPVLPRSFDPQPPISQV